MVEVSIWREIRGAFHNALTLECGNGIIIGSEFHAKRSVITGRAIKKLRFDLKGLVMKDIDKFWNMFHDEIFGVVEVA